MTPQAALAALAAHARPGKADEMAAYHKAPRRYLGVATPDIGAETTLWRKMLRPDDQLALARGLWATDVHEARIAAAKLIDRKRIEPDENVWRLIASWLPDFDAWAIADHASIAGQKRLAAHPARLDEVEGWTRSDHLWTRRAALVMTLPWARLADPSSAEQSARDRILGWAAGYVDDPEWFIQKAVAWWLRELSKRDPDRAREFLARHSARMKPFARRDAARHLTD